jgi:hypothetical protein
MEDMHKLNPLVVYSKEIKDDKSLKSKTANDALQNRKAVAPES